MRRKARKQPPTSKQFTMLPTNKSIVSTIKNSSLAIVALSLAFATHAGEVDGLWKWTTPGRNGGPERIYNLRLAAEGGTLTGKVITSNRTNDTFTEVEIRDGKIEGSDLSFNVPRAIRSGGNPPVSKYTGKLDGDKIEGQIESPARGGSTQTSDWKAERNTSGKLIAGPRLVIKPGYDENGHKIVNETHYKEVSVEEAQKFLEEHPDAIILDTRSPEEFASGHLPNAKNYNLTDDATYKSILAPLDKTKWYLVHSAVGHYRTVRALEYFETNGFEHALALDGGYNAWAAAGKPTVK
jgi:phage shock protein E